jgi:hypothetical protein
MDFNVVPTCHFIQTITTNNDAEILAMVGIVEITVKAHHHRDYSIHRIFFIGDVIENAAQDLLSAGTHLVWTITILLCRHHVKN